MSASFETPANYQYLLIPHSPDNREHYRPDEEWNRLSIQIMTEVAEMCKNDQITYEMIYRAVAKKRAEIAEIKKVDRYKTYGMIRNDYTRDYLSAARIWRWHEIFGTVDASDIYEVITPEGSPKGSAWSKQFEPIKKYVQNILGNEKRKYKVTYNNSNFTRTIATVTLVDDSLIRIKYATPQYKGGYLPNLFHSDFIIGTTLFNKMLSVTTEEEYLSALADYMRYESGILRSFLGSEGILQWIIGGVALCKGIQLSFKENEIGWNFKALITPSEQEYREFIKTISEVSLISDSTIINFKKPHCKILVRAEKPQFFLSSEEDVPPTNYDATLEKKLDKIVPLKIAIQNFLGNESSPRLERLYLESDLAGIIQSVRTWPSSAVDCAISEKELKLRSILADDYKRSVKKYSQEMYIDEIENMSKEEMPKEEMPQQCLVM